MCTLGWSKNKAGPVSLLQRVSIWGYDPWALLGPSQDNVGVTIRIRKLSTQRTGEDNYWLFSTRHTERWGNHTQAYWINMSASPMRKQLGYPK